MALEGDAYELVVAGPAARAIAQHLPEAVAIAVIDLITVRCSRVLVGSASRSPENSQGSGAAAGRSGSSTASMTRREVVVLRVDHRRTVYRRS